MEGDNSARQPRLGTKTTSGWCSSCLHYSQHRKVDLPWWRRGTYRCEDCGAATTTCTAIGCRNMALRATGLRSLACYCAEHNHSIRRFGAPPLRLKDIADYDPDAPYAKLNKAWFNKHLLLITSLTTAGAVAGGVLSPVLRKALQLRFSWPTTAGSRPQLALRRQVKRLVNSPQGPLVLSVLGGLAGAAYGSRFLNGYIDADRAFGVQKIREGTGPAVIIAQGFFSQNRQDWSREERFARSIYTDPQIYRVTWGAQNATRLGFFVGRLPTSYLGGWQLKKVLEAATALAGVSFGSFSALSAASSLVNNPWHVAVARAGHAGRTLAEILQANERTGWVLLGNSLGARVLVEALVALAEEGAGSRGGEHKIREVHLLGPAVDDSAFDPPATSPKRPATSAVSGRVYNYHSRRDLMLRLLYPLAQAGRRAAGYRGFLTTDPKVVNQDVTALVSNHFAYYEQLNTAFEAAVCKE